MAYFKILIGVVLLAAGVGLGQSGMELYDDSIGRGSGNWVVVLMSYAVIGVAAVLLLVGFLTLVSGLIDKIRAASTNAEQLEEPETISGEPLESSESPPSGKADI